MNANLHRYMGANIPGKKREQMVYLAGVDVYNKVVFEALEGWKGFEVKKESGDTKKGDDGVTNMGVANGQPEPVIG